MPDSDRERTDLADWVLALPCHVKIPEELRENFEKSGVAATAYDEARRFPRLLCGTSNGRGALEYRQTFPALPRGNDQTGVYVLDVSRGGCRLLNSQPLYPGELLGLVLLTGLRRSIEVVWCRRLGERCFSVGARFAELSSAT